MRARGQFLVDPALCSPAAPFSPSTSNHLQNHSTAVPTWPLLTSYLQYPWTIRYANKPHFSLLKFCPLSWIQAMPTSSLDTSILILSVVRCFIPSVKPSLLHYNHSVTCLGQTAIYLASLEEAENLFSPSGYTLCLTHWHCIYCKVRNSSNNLEKTGACRKLNIQFLWD